MDLPNIDNYYLKSKKSGGFLKRSLSTIGLGHATANLTLREARSFTGAVEELRSCNPKKQYICQTTEVTSNQIFIVKDEMLTYRGTRYSLNDIAIRWKKDCRTWLWKSKLGRRRNRSLGELREKMQNAKIQN
ncbi:uncharacterized protein LOC108738096 isoform X2 [Agrilus planipennis]|uniref:Uncharacterized protein LOC108738096 isoform X2 n=1 Tax=Agrilus planipennis TaxID=224129 RepID=A0A7F5R3K7_AGRPL|nr:uncharacterized protein LOC108738096 isoform X2 [Agrilus planipennis]